MKFSQLKGTAVVELKDACKLGDFEDLMIDPQTRQVIELKIKTGLFSSSTFIPVSWLKTVGPDAITVMGNDPGYFDNGQEQGPDQGQTQMDGSKSERAADFSASSGVATVETINTTNAGKKELMNLSRIIGNQVVSETGSLFGEVKDVLLDDTTLTISGYELSMGGLFSKTHRFPASNEVHYGPKLITIPEELIS